MADYIDKKALYEILLDYRLRIEAAEAAGAPRPEIPDSVSRAIVKIATNFTYHPWFIGYTWKEELISDGIFDCLKGVRNYDPRKFDNPFAYFTQICYRAFKNRNKKEKRQSYTKYKLLSELPFDVFDLQEHDEAGDFTNTFVEFMQEHGDGEKFKNYEESISSKNKKSTEPPKKRGRKAPIKAKLEGFED